MTYRERVLKTLRFERPDRLPDWEFGAWTQTIERWRGEGMDADGDDMFGPLERYFHTDSVLYGGPGPWIIAGLLPKFEWKVVDDSGPHQIIRDHDGALGERVRVGASIPRYIKFAIETRADWEKLRDERLDPDAPGRVPDDIDALAEQCRDADYPLSLRCGSLYGWLRNWMGVENLSLALYDDPAFVEEMMEHLTRLTLAQLEKLAGKFTVDIAYWWEDMCYRHGSLLSPAMFNKLMVPRYKRITGFLRENFDCRFNCLDCDGNIHELIRPWLDSGINVMFPVEVPHTDAFAIRREFGKDVPMSGAFDKRALIAGPDAIDAEWRRILPLMNEGGLIPHTDHLVPPDVSFENYMHYRRRKCEIIGKEWIEPGVS